MLKGTPGKALRMHIMIPKRHQVQLPTTSVFWGWLAQGGVSVKGNGSLCRRASDMHFV